MCPTVSEKTPESGTENELLTLARARDLDALEAAWIEKLESASPDFDELFPVARYLVGKHLDEQAGLLLWSLIESVGERQDARATLAVAKRAALTAPLDRNLRREVAARFRQAYPDTIRFSKIIEESNLLDADDLEAALRTVEDFLVLQPGTYVIHRLSQRVGRVKAFEHGTYVVEAQGSEHRHEPSHVLGYWAPVDADDFRALAVFESDRLRELSETDPDQLIRLMAQTYKGRIEFKQLKSALIPAVIPEAQWPKWWSSTKATLKRSPWIELSDGTQPTLALRAQAASYGKKVLERFENADDPIVKASQVLEYVSDMRSGTQSDVQAAENLGAALLQESARWDTAPALAMLAAAAALRKAVPDAPDPGQELAHRAGEIEDAGDVIAKIGKDDVARAVLESLKTACPERWPELYAEAFPSASLRMCDWIARELHQAGEQSLFTTAAEKTAAMPDDYPLAFGWVWRRVLTDGDPLAERISPVTATTVLLHLIHRIERLPRHAQNRAESRRALSKLRSLTGANSSKRLKDLIARSDADDAVRIHEAVTGCDGLTSEVRHALLDALREKHPERFVEQQNLWEDGHIYLSAEGYAKCQAALSKIVNEDMPKNATAIGTAAAKGDLRENWEYKSALEERDRLVDRAGRIREQLDRVRVLNPGDVSGEQANVGTSVRLRETATGQERTVTFLGTWDADIENGVYSYLAPLSRRFMGKKVGDRVTANFGGREAEYEITSIERAV